MKENWKKYLIWVAIVLASFLLFSVLKSFWINKGRSEIESECTQKLIIQAIAFEETLKVKNDLLSIAVKEKYDEKFKGEEKVRDISHAFQLYKEKTSFDFDEIEFKLLKAQTANRNLRKDLIDAKAMILSLSVINRNVISDWELSDTQLHKSFDVVMKVSAEATAEKYINFINKIERIKNSKKSWRGR